MPGGHRNISNALTIGTKIDRASEGVKEAAKEAGWWDGSSEFNFAAAFSADDNSGGRQECGEKLLAQLSEGGLYSQANAYVCHIEEDPYLKSPYLRKLEPQYMSCY